MVAERDIEVLVKERDLEALLAEVKRARFMNRLQKVVIVLMLIASLLTIWVNYEKKMLNQRYANLIEHFEQETGEFIYFLDQAKVSMQDHLKKTGVQE